MGLSAHKSCTPFHWIACFEKAKCDLRKKKKKKDSTSHAIPENDFHSWSKEHAGGPEEKAEKGGTEKPSTSSSSLDNARFMRTALSRTPEPEGQI